MFGCASCGSENPEGFRFCGAYAEPLVASAPAHMREERKTVTVLFADLAGFTARSDGADPEDVLALVRPFHGILRHETEAFGGTLARIVGDAGIEQALATWTDQGWLVPRARVLMWLGRCLLATGDTHEGIARLEEARAFWAPRGARPRLAEIDALLASVGADPEGTPGPAGC